MDTKWNDAVVLPQVEAATEQKAKAESELAEKNTALEENERRLADTEQSLEEKRKVTHLTARCLLTVTPRKQRT